MVDIGLKTRKTDLCSTALADTRKVPIEIWVRETKPIIERLTALQTENKLTYAAFGATALGALGYSRATKDVDIVVKKEEWNCEKVAEVLSEEFNLTVCKKEGQKVIMLVKEIEGYHFVIELWDDYIYVMDCDDQMWKRAQVGQNLGFPIITLSTEDMVSSKLGRFFVEKQKEDIMDIAFLLKTYGIRNFDYFVQRIEKIKRHGKTIDEFLFEEMVELSKLLGKTDLEKIHAEIVKRRPYKQLLVRIMFNFSRECSNLDEMAEKTILQKGELEAILKKLQMETKGKGFTIPKNPDGVIAKVLNEGKIG